MNILEKCTKAAQTQDQAEKNLRHQTMQADK